MAFLREETIENSRLPIFVNGEFAEPNGAKLIDSFDPTTGEAWYQVHDCDAEEVDRAVAAAEAAFKAPSWRGLSATDRGDLLFKLAGLIGNYAADLAQIETRDNGKLLKETSAQIGYLARYYRYFAGLADKMQGDVIPINRADMLNYTTREPLGVVGLIVPWNSPLNTMSVTVAAALAAGNTVLVKPSEHTSASAVAFAHLIKEAGFPDGVFNVVTGFGATTGDALTRHPDIAKIAFTGGTATGAKVAQNAASHVAPCVLELGGKSPHVVFDDADIDRASNGVIAGIYAAAGQTCVAGSRVFVQKPIYDEFVERLAAKARTIVLGHPKDPKTQLGPLATKDQHDKVDHYARLGEQDGARLVVGGHKAKVEGYEAGYFFEPTLFANVSNDMRIATDEVFGPFACVLPFENESDLMRAANDCRYGLASGIWTQDIDKAMRFARDVEAGTVWVNTYRTAAFTTPMGGFKDSGYGKHNGIEAMLEWTRSKNVMIDYSGATQDAFVMRIK